MRSCAPRPGTPTRAPTRKRRSRAWRSSTSARTRAAQAEVLRKDQSREDLVVEGGLVVVAVGDLGRRGVPGERVGHRHLGEQVVIRAVVVELLRIPRERAVLAHLQSLLCLV